jgi:DUF4097 and DUF4098 domain-containing protein YvlB
MFAIYVFVAFLTINPPMISPETSGASSADITDTVKEVIKVRGAGTLSIDVDNGNITVETIRASEVRIEIERVVGVSSRDDARRILERHEYSFDQRGDNVTVRSRVGSETSLWNRRSRDRIRVNIRVQVPEQYNVDFTSGAGNITLGDLGGSVKGRTGAGNIRVGAVQGELVIDTGSGNIEVAGVRGPVRISTGAGNVRLDDARESVTVSSGAGNITAFITQQPRATSVLETGAGNVTVHLSGNARAHVDASAGMGSASTDFPLTVEGKWVSKSFAGDLNGGGPSIRMRAGVGNVSLRRL